MRSLIARLIFSGLIGAAIAGCGTSGSSLPAGGVQNDAGAGSGTNVTVSASSATPPPFSIPPVLLDSGSEGLSAATPTPTPVTWKEVLTNGPASTETQSPLYSTSDTLPATAPAGSPTYPPQSFAGSHLVTFAGSGTSQVILQIQKTLPDLVYTYKSTNPGNNAITAYTYSTIVAHLTYIGAATAPALVSTSVELTGSNGTAGSFDVRVACTGTPGAAAGTFAKVTCPKLPASGAVSNTTGPNPVIPGATGPFDPVAAYSWKLYLVLNYASAIPTTVTGNQIYIDNVYATQ